MNNLPAFDYTTKMDTRAFRQANWAANRKVFLKRYLIAVALYLPISTALFSTGQSNSKSSSTPGMAILVGFLIALSIILTMTILAVLALYVHVTVLINKQIRDFEARDFHTSIKDEILTIRNPVNGNVRSYPLKNLSKFIESNDYYMLKADHEYVYIGKAGLQSAGALEYFESKIKR